jgi:hypothetical protein
MTVGRCPHVMRKPSSFTPPGSTILASPPTCATYSSGVGPAMTGAAGAPITIQSATATAEAVIAHRPSFATAAPFQSRRPLNRHCRLAARPLQPRGRSEIPLNRRPRLFCHIPQGRDGPAEQLQRAAEKLTPKLRLPGVGIRLDRLHIRIREAKMMADLVHENMGDKMAESLITFRPVIEDRATVQENHIRLL